MWSAAMASSCWVVTPGATAARISSRASPTTRPASRISAICSGVLISTPRSRNTTSDVDAGVGTDGGQRADGTLGDLVDRSLRGDRAQQASLLVETHERRRLLGVDLEPTADRVGLVVVALEELAGVDVADTFLGRRVELDVPHVAALTARTPSGQPANHLVVVDLQLEHDVERRTEVVEHVAERLGLGQRAREPVEQEPVLGVVLAEAVADDA